uniref:Family with sequence similarity 91 member A1 n=1 Tax=Sander lucioperca TaxID=283035 RepID=A0A8C9XR51_SANLU
MNTDVEFHIRQNYPWTKLPANVKQSLGNSQREYEKHVLLYSIRNQLRFRNNLVRHVRKDERKYYEELLKYSRDHLMLYPYHLSDIMCMLCPSLARHINWNYEPEHVLT